MIDRNTLMIPGLKDGIKSYKTSGTPYGAEGFLLDLEYNREWNSQIH